MNIIFLEASSNSGQNPYFTPIFFVLLIVVFYFFMIRPQMKRQKEVRKFREGLQKGDKVITAGGIYGKITEVQDNHLIIEIDTNVRIKVDKASVVASPEDIPQQPK
ncbi:MAG: preprotein translocase subunit YajC [Bacteroidales bacterium]|jgi:preprotein translocase subunit YajC|nr:preprotein translocase subunit YajC [Bacteroidales bacterium]MCK9498946.1 preprotein translocase subunit YajC [Bacteroidales bacterium]MDY0313465.1 preprotein translocase subunit YajC [Bacteroidales bacterium]NLB86122.1 preprotein translocase subunit YajC [Bacteroidales bacterium]